MKISRQKLPFVLKNVLIIISNTTGLSSELKRIGLFASTIVALFYLLVLYLFFISKLQKYFSFSTCSKTLLKSTCQDLLLLVGFDTLTYRKDYDRSPILVGQQDSFLAPLPGSEALLVSGIGKERFYCRCCFYFFACYFASLWSALRLACCLGLALPSYLWWMRVLHPLKLLHLKYLWA